MDNTTPLTPDTRRRIGEAMTLIVCVGREAHEVLRGLPLTLAMTGMLMLSDMMNEPLRLADLCDPDTGTEEQGVEVMFGLNGKVYDDLTALGEFLAENGAVLVNGLGQTPAEALRYVLSADLPD